ncbi:hypothetical protein B0H16DRAFT_1555129 [Mycena metata]|uniref:Uncharacterized protein n=1 Tax=Mycena metata TaxID=1033252 RepID=A0AAD7IR98_9AGAR|nr:hypothetical protein B0H16DRAFT_1555129 [Mycena metata]
MDLHHMVPGPGNPTYFPALLALVRDLAPPSLPLDAVIFQSILLCLISGEKHLLLRAPEKDVRLVVKLAFLTLSSVFGLPTHKLKVRPPSTSPGQASGTPFLRSLFLPWTAPIDSQDELSSKHSGSSRNRNRNNATWARSSSRRPRRSTSELVGTTTGSNPFGDSHDAVVNPFTTASRSSTKARAPLPHAFSDPTPVRPKLDRAVALQPRALVISGLEHATIQSQRALTRALAEKRVVLEDEDGDEGYDEVWNLPDNFMMVYVCPFDARERPTIHKSLLDKFAMSATVSPHHTVRALLSSPSRNSGSYRNSPALHASPLPQSQTTPTSSPNFSTQSVPLPHHSHSLPIGHHHVHHPVLQQPLVPPTLLHDLRASYYRTHLSPVLSLYASDLFSAARHHPQLDGTLLTAKSLKDVIDLARAGRVIGGDLTGIELVRDDAAYLAPKVDSAAKPESDNDEYSPLTTPVTANGSHGSHPNGNPNGLAHRYQPIEVVVEEVDTDGEATPGPGAGAADVQPRAREREPEPEVLEVSEADIARIAPRVMTHRLRVRDGPHDEGGHPDPDAKIPARCTVKNILVRILAEV